MTKNDDYKLSPRVSGLENFFWKRKTSFNTPQKISSRLLGAFWKLISFLVGVDWWRLLLKILELSWIWKIWISFWKTRWFLWKIFPPDLFPIYFSFQLYFHQDIFFKKFFTPLKVFYPPTSQYYSFTTHLSKNRILPDIRWLRSTKSFFLQLRGVKNF